ncbi:hypothetical protein LJ739_06760 [Aestuariibacter halophilus]|uniref:Uncharacterized protein n=1 Tax=Fluctibacter halophilus TaxID=226011 RepID=A0ABS8G5R2_9ALTE|nr:hypothetical protein [Aestuariibacter halophilus]MCC2615937.1 hypothetical protein [Aestuariibacter halophilus]
MFLDSQLQFAADQNLTATGNSTNTIDLGSDRDIGKGEPMGIVVCLSDADTTTGDETYTVGVQTDDNSAFSSAATLASAAIPSSELKAGGKLVIPLGHNNERYLRLALTLAGTTPSITYSAFLQPLSMIDGYENYQSGFIIS